MIQSDPIQQRSLSDEVAERIKKQILSIKLKPGTRLLVDVLAENLGVSRTPIREGLKQLIPQGLVTYDGKSYFVTIYTEQDIKEVYAIRRALEVLAAKLAALAMDDTMLSELENICIAVEEGMGEQDDEFFVSMDIKFHELIDNSTQNMRLKKMLFELREQTLFIRHSFSYPNPTSYRENLTVKEHELIVDALKKHDEDGAAKMMELHLINGEKRTLDFFNTI